MDEAISDFSSITGATAQVARHFLSITDGDTEQAIQLFFDSPDLGSALAQEPPPVPPASTRPPPRDVSTRHPNPSEVIEIDSDGDYNMSPADDHEDPDDGGFQETSASIPQARPSHSSGYEDDEAMARRMQEELYAGGDMSGDFGEEGVRAPLARTTETLVGPGSDWHGDDMQAAVLQQMRARAQARSGLGRPFNQQTPSSSSSIWDESDHRLQAESMARTIGGSAESSKAAKLVELFRPPFELISRLSWDEAREQGKADEKWILVNVQDPSIFDCQALNRDIWKHDGIRETVKENFIFMQYSKDDPRGSQYIQYYFHQVRDDQSAYPHIAIVDPRTGEQLKVWSGPPPPKAMDFLMQLHEFLDRYSLNVGVKNPVAKRKAEKSASIDVDKLTEEQMLDLALQNSLANGNNTGPKEYDPDDLTRSVGDLSKGKGKMVEEEEENSVVEGSSSNGHGAETSAATPFASVSSNQPHSEPANDPATTTRIQFRHSSGRIIRRFNIADPIRRIYEWLKAAPVEEGKEGVEFELKSMGRDLMESLEVSIADAGLKNGTVMIEYLED